MIGGSMYRKWMYGYQTPNTNAWGAWGSRVHGFIGLSILGPLDPEDPEDPGSVKPPPAPQIIIQNYDRHGTF